MLARDLKLKTARRQRDFILKQFMKLSEAPDGDTSYTYSGYLYPEVIEFFKNEGFDIKLVESELLLASNHGLPTYLFTVRDDIKITDEEMEEGGREKTTTKSPNSLEIHESFLREILRTLDRGTCISPMEDSDWEDM